MRAIGFDVHGVDNPFAALVELLDRPLVYRSIVLSLAAMYREELALVKTIRLRLPHVDVLLTHIEGRSAAFAEAMRLGATGLLDDKAVHRLGEIDPPPGMSQVDLQSSPAVSSPPAERDAHKDTIGEDDLNDFDPILTAEELRALLQVQPMLPGNG